MGITYFLTLSVLMHRLPCTFFLVGRLAGQFSGSPFELFPNGNTLGLGTLQHAPGIFRKASGDGVGLPALEKQQVFVRPGLIKGIVHIPAPGHPVKVLWGLHLDAVRGGPWPMSWRTVCFPWGVWRARYVFLIFRPTARHAWASTRPVSFVALIETAMVRLETSSSISRIPPFHEKSTSGQSVQKCRYRSSCSFAAIFR